MADQDRKRKLSGRPDSRMSEELDTLILKTATRLFGEQGYVATSVEQIAAWPGWATDHLPVLPLQGKPVQDGHCRTGK
uniref:helix-turn-helix domain-containing protein n=1 Tax=Komagataeibacter xylinus TaxID=28448 RepID=UPI000A5062FD|nr:helix-turn-helix domain-containing protein [Komagataeibacter xylinus]